MPGDGGCADDLAPGEPAARADGRRVVGAAGSGDAGRCRMMDRRNFLSTIGLGVLAAPRAADAQSATKAGRIAVVVPAARQNSFMEDFFVSLREAGYIEGRNLAVDRRFMAGRENEYDQVMAELEQQHVDVIFAAGPPAALAARRVVKVVPVVFTACGRSGRDRVGSESRSTRWQHHWRGVRYHAGDRSQEAGNSQGSRARC